VLLDQAETAFADAAQGRDESSVGVEELRALGTFITIEAGDAAYPLTLDRLEQWSRHRTPSKKRPHWLLMSSTPATGDQPERAVVWVSDKHRAKFLKLFEDYLAKLVRRGSASKWETPGGNPKNRALVANIAAIRTTILRDLWQSDGEPDERGVGWWELWLASTMSSDDVLAALGKLGIRAATRATVLSDRVVVWVHAAWGALQVLPFTSLPLAEIRRPSFIDTIEDLTRAEQAEWADDLAARLAPADEDAPAVCHLDTGVARTHVLLSGSLAPTDLMTVVGSTGFDVDGHGTKMAGIALYGDLDPPLQSTGPVVLRHRLESVRILPSPRRAEPPHDPLDYGTVTSQAVATAEVNHGRRRVFCLPIAADPDRPGDPSLWSATVDAVCVGTDIVRDHDRLRLIGAPDSAAARVVVVAAGNTDVEGNPGVHPQALSDVSGILDPGQAWNALTVGAHTNLTRTPTGPAFHGWRAVADAGDLSPHSRTSTVFARTKWPIKPDICLEGGNVLTDGDQVDVSHPLVSVRTTGVGNDQTITSANATSAAAAAAARLAALAMTEYPDYWPETIRGLLVHAADWTPLMAGHIDDKRLDKNLGQRLAWLRRYGWGVPNEDTVLHSSRKAVTPVAQDTFTPFDADFKMRHFRLHTLPWPKQILQEIGGGDVQLRVTLSYYIEPNPSRRGWRQRYAYASHGLRFELQAPLEQEHDFITRVSGNAAAEEEDDAARMPKPSTGADRWLVGPRQRNTGSLHQDIWNGHGADLAACDHIAVFPVGGWWKNNARQDRAEQPVRYTLIVSLRAREQSVDLYTPIATQLRVPVPVDIPAT
jgi:hypothetical protein